MTQHRVTEKHNTTHTPPHQLCNSDADITLSVTYLVFVLIHTYSTFVTVILFR